MHHTKAEDLAELLIEALKAIEGGRYDFACATHVERDMAQFGLADLEAYLDLIHQCIQIAICDPVACHRPPQERISTAHVLTRGLLMHAFEVWHEDFKTHIYFKFCLKLLKNGKFYCHIDCHESNDF